MSRMMNRMALVNWGSFEQPEYIRFGKKTLFSGENGTGKTMTFDAMLYALFGITDFNAAAKTEGERRQDKRNVRKYLHGSTQDIDNPYLRPGEVISWCVLEFRDTERDAYFLCGQVSESKDVNTYDTYWFVFDDCRIEDLRFRSSDGTEIYSRRECTVKGLPARLDWFYKKEKGLAQIAAALGIRGKSSQVASVIRRILALNPQANVNEFIAESILEDRAGNNDVLDALRKMQENLGRLTGELERLEKERAVLREADGLAMQHRKKKEELLLGEMKFLYSRAAKQDAEIEQKKNEIASLEASLRQLGENEASLGKKSETVQEDLLRIENSPGLEKIREVKQVKKRNIGDLENEERGLEEKCVRLVRFREQARQVIDSFERTQELQGIRDGVSSSDAGICRAAAGRLKDFVAQNREKETETAYGAGQEARRLMNSIREAGNTLKLLKENRSVFPEKYMNVRNILEAHFTESGRNVPVRIAVEMISSVKDPEWQAAIETVLGNRRFYILVPAEYEEEAYGVMKKMRLSGVDLVTTSAIPDREAPEGTAAAMLEITNHDARKYFNRIIGDVWLAGSEKEVLEFTKKGRRSITKDGTQSSGYSRRLNRLERVLYIGAEARLARIRTLEEEISGMNKNLFREKKKQDQANARLKKMNEIYFDDSIAFGAEKDLEKVRGKLSAAKEDLERYEKENEDAEAEVTAKRKELRQIQDLIRENSREQGKQEKAIEDAREAIEKKQAEKEAVLKEYREYTEKYPDYEFEIMEEMDRAKKEKKAFSVPGENRLREMRTDLQNLLHDMVAKQKEYRRMCGGKNVDYTTGEAYIPAFRQILNDLEDVRFEESMEAIRKQKEGMRRNVIQNFIAKLTEQIESAHREKNRRNRVLRGMKFGQQEYQFVISKKTDDEAKTLFYLISDEMKSLSSPEALMSILDMNPEINGYVAKFLDIVLKDVDSTKYTDYRNYIQCDMLITENDGARKYMLSSKAGESSNGEKQTPYLIILAVSLCDLYPDGTGAAKLCFMDEAFAAWSDDRIRQMLQYFDRNGFQMVFAAPDKSFGAIGKYMDSVVACVKPKESPYTYYCDGHETVNG